MKFEYTMTIEDLREARQAVAPVEKFSTPSRALSFWLALFFVCVVGATHRDDMHRDLPEENLWVALAPSLIIITYLAQISVMVVVNERAMRKTGTRPTWSLASELVFCLMFLWGILVIFTKFRLVWSPTDGQMVWAGLAPWALYFSINGYRLIRKAKNELAQLWKRSPSLHRTNYIEVNAEGFSWEDGVVSHFFRWPYYKRYSETNNLLLLTNVDGQATFIAKRAITDPAAMDELRMLIQQNIAEGKFMDRPAGFPVLPVVAATPP